MTIDPTENPKIDHRIREFLQVLNSRDGKPIETLTPEEVSKIVVKPQNPTSWTKLMKTHYYLSLVTKALTGAMLIACTVVQAEAADDVKVTELMTKDLMNVPGKE